jgi:AraC-like DNA-binding protein
MLDGYDKEWRNADRTRMATYNDLPTGSYHFKVKAFLLESPEKFDMRDIEVEVPPYFILSSGAIWLYMALFLTLGIWFLLWNQNKLEKSEKLRMLREGPRSHNNIKENDDFLIFLNDYLALHFSDPMLSVEDMVQAADMSEDKFLSQLRRSSGMSPKEYVSEYRVRQAMTMLESTSDDISKIAYNCGYIDVASFNRNFKLLTGFMPSRYRDMHKV